MSMEVEWAPAGAARQTGRTETPARRRRDPVLTGAAIFGAVFFVFGLIHLNFDYGQLWKGTLAFVRSWAYLFPPNAAEWQPILAAALETLYVAVVGTVLAVAVAFVLAFFAAENVAPKTAPLVKGFVSLLRAVPTLVWALIFIVAVGMGPLPGILAIFTHAVGMLTKMFAQSIEEVDEGVLEALRATGAGWLQVMLQGVLPCVSTSFLAWSVFRLEVDIGESTILGVVGAGGIGWEMANAMRNYEFDTASFVGMVIFAMVYSVEFATNRLKNRIRLRG